MLVGACGICCDVCGLKVKGICQGCCPGNDPNAVKKLEFLRSINAVCPILECAAKRGIAYCSRDCEEFPCKIFMDAQYPFSRAFLEMYKSRLPKQ